MESAAFWLIVLSPLSWLWVAYDATRPRYYSDDGRVFRSALEAEDASK